ILANRLPKAGRPNRVAGLELDRGQSLIQAHLGRFHSWKLHQCYAHGVGTGHSIHAEDGDVHLKKLRTSRQDQTERQAKQSTNSLHMSPPLLSEKDREIECHPNAFARIDKTAVSVHGELHASRDGVVLVDAECGGPYKDLVASA